MGVPLPTPIICLITLASPHLPPHFFPLKIKFNKVTLSRSAWQSSSLSAGCSTLNAERDNSNISANIVFFCACCVTFWFGNTGAYKSYHPSKEKYAAASLSSLFSSCFIRYAGDLQMKIKVYITLFDIWGCYVTSALTYRDYSILISFKDSLPGAR